MTKRRTSARRGKGDDQLGASIVIFGASGDLTQRKLMPSLFHLHATHRLPKSMRIVGLARSDMSTDEFRDKMRNAVETAERSRSGPDPDVWKTFADRLTYVPGNFKEDADFERLDAHLNDLELGPTNRLYYLATPPAMYPTIVEKLGSTGMANGAGGWRRIVVEKPFGTDLASAQALNRALHAVFDEASIFRMDHFLGKETAQNLLFFRFANTVFEPVWNRNYVDHVQITVAERIDVAHRGAYYDKAGVLRDMFQNHLLQLLSLAAMEPPISFDADAVRDEKVKLLRAIRPMQPDGVAQNTVRGQYAGYRDADDVDPDSTTETYGALRLHIDNWRWQGVPFYLRSGKAMATKTTEIIVWFRAPPHLLFQLEDGDDLLPNMLALCIEPDEGIHLRFEVKVPNTLRRTDSVDMEFHYEDAFGGDAIRDAYVRLLLDALEGDQTLFTRSDAIEQAWLIIDPIAQAWEHDAVALHSYRRGSWGPEAADAFMAAEQRNWVLVCAHGV